MTARRQKALGPFGHAARENDRYEEALRQLPRFIRRIELNHENLFWGFVFLTPVLFSGLKELHKKFAAEGEARRQKE